MFYHDQINKVVEDFKSSRCPKNVAIERLIKIENDAYKIITDAEPDGDITYAVALALDEIDP